MNNKYYNPNDDHCLGCGRPEIHKSCPAYGTDFYISGILYTEAMEKIREEHGVGVVNQLLKALKQYET